MMNVDRISVTLLYKNYRNITLTLYFSKGVVADVCVWETGRRRETKEDGHFDPQLPLLLLLTILRCVIFRTLNLCFFDFLAMDHCGPWSHWARCSLCPWQSVCRSKISDGRLTTARLLVSTVAHVYIISKRPRILFVTHVSYFRLFSTCASCNHFVYITGTSSSLKD